MPWFAFEEPGNEPEVRPGLFPVTPLDAPNMPEHRVATNGSIKDDGVGFTMDWKLGIRRLARRFGYDVVRHYPEDEEVDLYIKCPPYPYRTYAPWFEAEFQEFYRKIADRTVVREDRCYILRQLARQVARLDGSYAECGVYRGGTAFLIADAIQHSGKELDLFDTFEGMPEGTQQDPSGHKVGDFGDTSLEQIQTFLSRFDRIRYFQGLIPQTFEGVSDSRYCFVHVDVDLYQSVLDCCEFFYERLVPRGVMCFDDYGAERYREAAMKAVDGFFADKPDEPMSLRTGQCLVFKG